jgi:hypothetical protein
MISRIVTVAALMAGTALLCVSAQAQTGAYGQTTVTPGGSASGSVGTTGTVPRGTVPSTSTSVGTSGGASTSTMPAQGNVGAQGNMNANTGPRGANVQGNTGAQGQMQGNTMQGGSMQGGSMQGGMQGGANYQAQAPRGRRMTDAAERQITECLNSAAGQQRPLNSCQR